MNDLSVYAEATLFLAMMMYGTAGLMFAVWWVWNWLMTARRQRRAERILSPQWVEDCKRWRGHVLTGKYGHWCPEWDDLPIDETCPEWPCDCGIEVKHHQCEVCGKPTKPGKRWCWQ